MEWSVSPSHYRGCSDGANQFGLEPYSWVGVGSREFVGKVRLRGSSWSTGGWLTDGQRGGIASLAWAMRRGWWEWRRGAGPWPRVVTACLSRRWATPACSPRLLPLSGHFKGICLPSLFQSHFCPCSLSLLSLAPSPSLSVTCSLFLPLKYLASLSVI